QTSHRHVVGFRMALVAVLDKQRPDTFLEDFHALSGWLVFGMFSARQHRFHARPGLCIRNSRHQDRCCHAERQPEEPKTFMLPIPWKTHACVSPESHPNGHLIVPHFDRLATDALLSRWIDKPKPRRSCDSGAFQPGLKPRTADGKPRKRGYQFLF